MAIYKNQVTCEMVVFVQDLKNVKSFLNGISEFAENGVYWRAIHYGIALEVNFVTKVEYVEQIKERYGELVFELKF